ncbi:hypothetical protein Gotur_029548 [Gossypium turneri]
MRLFEFTKDDNSEKNNKNNSAELMSNDSSANLIKPVKSESMKTKLFQLIVFNPMCSKDLPALLLVSLNSVTFMHDCAMATEKMPPRETAPTLFQKLKKGSLPTTIHPTLH